MITQLLFVCTANACRSQMAEGIARALCPAGVTVSSAGSRPTQVDPRAVQVMAEIGLDISAHSSKSLQDVVVSERTLVITLCDDEAKSCPSLPGTAREHWPLQDPAQATGTTTAILDAFRTTRDEILALVSERMAALAPAPAVGILGGSGFYDVPGLTNVRTLQVDTPFGSPSGPLVEGSLHGRRVVFLPRHGPGHHLLPSEVNARANIFALKRAGVSQLISVSAVGSLREEIAPGDVVLPRQFLDRTVGRPSTFFGQGVVAHVSLADPVCGRLADSLTLAARAQGARVHAQGTYVCIEGPQFSPRAESAFFRASGADVVGMTNLPEARLAREAEICYATLTLPTDYDSWRPQDEVRVTDVLSVLRANVERARTIVLAAVAALSQDICSCQRVLDTALLTPTGALSTASRVRLHAVLARRLTVIAEPS